MTDKLKDLRVLIVEDESMVSMLIEDMLVDLGCSVAGTAAKLDEARTRVSSLEFDAAVLDVNVNGSSVYPVAKMLLEKGIPFVLATGYGAPAVRDLFAGIPVLGKPFDKGDLEKALRAALGCS